MEAGLNQKAIAKQIGISEGRLSKEIFRNGGCEKYDPDKADKRAVKLQHKAHVHYKYSDEVWEETEAMIMEDLSPEQAVGRRAAKDGRGSITGQTPIDLRPAIVDEKGRFGDFEIDLINGAHHTYGDL